MVETFERGKKYVVRRKWSDQPPDNFPRLKQIRYELEVGEVLHFRGPNFTGAEFLDRDGKLVILPVKTAFKIMDNVSSSIN